MLLNRICLAEYKQIETSYMKFESGTRHLNDNKTNLATTTHKHNLLKQNYLDFSGGK